MTEGACGLTHVPAMTRVLIAFDKFKNSLSAGDACAVAAEALARRHPDWELDLCPLADGGEGFGKILTECAGGEWREATVTGPRGQPASAGFGMVRAGSVPASVRKIIPLDPDDLLGVIEMALASGLAQLPASRRDPWLAESTGTGELISAAASAGAKAILLGIGGSATNDLGLCALSALGLEALDRDGDVVDPPTPARWKEIVSFRGSAAVPALFFACDVTNPLLGPSGSAPVYGPQKGLLEDEIGPMEEGAARIAGLLCEHFGKPHDLVATPGAGAAGGIGFGFLCAAGARFLSGADLVSDWLDLAARMGRADIVITGEGRFDASSLRGKGPGELAMRASAAGKMVFIFPGSAEPELAVPGGGAVCPITPSGMPVEEALTRAGELLSAAVSRI